MHKHTTANKSETDENQNVMYMSPQFNEVQLKLDGKNYEIIKTAICYTCLKPWTKDEGDKKMWQMWSIQCTALQMCDMPTSEFPDHRILHQMQ